MDEKTVVITIRDNDRDPLCVSASRLTADSSVFRYLINDLGLTELELEDFSPETATLFLTLLEDKTVNHIEDEQFNELHKISMVFKVDWLIEQCRNWLIDRIEQIDNTTDYDICLFLFEECLYILNKWDVRKFADLLTSKLAHTDNSCSFISRYAENWDDLKTNQLDLLLKVAGCNTKVILEIIMLQITDDKQSLDENTKFLLKKINLACCFEQNEELYQELFEKLSSMSDISNEDVRQMFRLMTETTRDVSSRKSYTRSTDNTVFDSLPWDSLYNSCKKLDDITRFIVAEQPDIRNMWDVVELLIYVTSSDNPPSTEESQRYINELVNIIRDNPLNKISSRLIDMWISVWRLSEREEIMQLIKTLQIIKDSCNLSSYHENVQLVGKMGADSFVVSSLKKLFRIEDRINDGSKILFEFSHPCISHCELKGKCGFILKYVVQRDNSFKVELCREKADYTGTGIHYHDIVSVEDMYYYVILPGTTPDGTRVTLPIRRWWWGRMLPANITWQRSQLCVDFNISKYLVAKH